MICDHGDRVLCSCAYLGGRFILLMFKSYLFVFLMRALREDFFPRGGLSKSNESRSFVLRLGGIEVANSRKLEEQDVVLFVYLAVFLSGFSEYPYKEKSSA